METQDVLADHMHGCRPAALLQTVQLNRPPVIQQRCEIAQQGIEPHIEGVAFMAWYGQAPAHIHPRD